MKNMMILELKKSILNIRFLISAIIGISLSLWHMIIFVIPTAQNMAYVKAGQEIYPMSVFNSCIFNSQVTLPYELFYTLLPILAVLPYGDSFFLDKKSGYLRNVMTRTRKKNYFISKYVASFVSAALVVFIPMFVSLATTALWLPAVKPELSTATFAVGNTTLWNELYVSHPFVFTWLMILITIIFAGLMACIALSVTDLFYKKFAILLFPFLLYLFSKYVFSSLNLNIFSPFLYLKNGYVYGASGTIVMIELLSLLVLTSALFIIKGVRDEIY